MRILFVSANSAEAYLDIEREQRTLVKLAEQGRHFLKLLPAAQLSDLEQELGGNGHPGHRYDVLHFAGHGELAEGLLLRRSDEDPTPVALTAEQLVALLDAATAAGTGLRLVVLNACETEPLVAQATGHVSEIIGTRWPVKDRTAWRFTSQFYAALHGDATVAAAFESATDPSGPYLRAPTQPSIKLPPPEPVEEAKVEGLGAFYDRYYGDYVDRRIAEVERDRNLNNYVFYGMLAFGVCLWIYLFQTSNYAGANQGFATNLQAALVRAFLPSNDSGVALFSLQDLWARLESLEGFAPALIAFFQRRVASHLNPKLAGLQRLRDSIRRWDELPVEDQEMIRSAMHTSLKEALENGE